MDSSVSPKDEIWFLCLCHHISNAVYHTEKEAQNVGRNIARFPAPNGGFSIPNNFASVATESAVLPLSLQLVTTLMFAETEVVMRFQMACVNVSQWDVQTNRFKSVK